MGLLRRLFGGDSGPRPLDQAGTRHRLEVEVDYHQFYLTDGGTDFHPPEDYSDEDLERRVKASDSLLVIQPVRNGQVPVELEIVQASPATDLEPWQHAVEASLRLPTGRLQVQECVGDVVLDLAVPPGTYRVLTRMAGMDSLSEDEPEGGDRYRLDLWRAPWAEVQVLKQWDDRRTR